MNCICCGVCREDLDSTDRCIGCGGVDENDDSVSTFCGTIERSELSEHLAACEPCRNDEGLQAQVNDT
jgi:hypothetical protein